MLIYTYGDPPAAISVLQKARNLDPLSPIIITLGEAYSYAGNLVEGLRLYRKALEIDPDYLAAFRLLSANYQSLGDTDRAAYWLDEGLRRGPDETHTLFLKAFLYRALGEAERAVAIARRLQAE